MKSLSQRKTKIVATIGPASWEEDLLRQCLQAGMNVARLNFSHGELERHSQTVKNLRKVSQEMEAPVAILQDLQGPKIRLADFKEEKYCEKGEEVWVSGPDGDPESEIVIKFPRLSEYLEVGQSVFIDDGIVELKVLRKEKDKILCEVLHGGVLRSRKGVNLPDADLPIDSLTEKDIEDLEAGVPLGFDYVALSFVRSPQDIELLRKKMKFFGSKARIVAKIEKKEAVNNIEEIIKVSDAVMIARGDLAVEIGQVHLPAVQKKITQLCNLMGKPVITATQMLDSMQENSRPTRAEITDVANAVLDGSDALMLSGESAFGKYPVRSIQTMHEIVIEVEKQRLIYYKFKNRLSDPITVPESIAMSAVLCAKQLKAKTIVCMSTTGRTASLISKFRPKAQLIAATGDQVALNRLELCWGVQTLIVEGFSNTEEAIERIEEVLVAHQIVEPGDHVVMTLGLPVIRGQKTNATRVFTIGQSRVKKVADEKMPLRYKEMS